MIRLAALACDVPVDPDADQARRWLADELAKPDYQRGPNLLRTIMDWISEQLNRLEGTLSTAPGGLWLYVVLALVVIGLVVTLIVIGPVRARRGAAAPQAVLIDETRTAAQLRAAARTAADRAEWRLAVIEQYRAIVRALEERVILDEKPGRTAHEVAPDAAAALPDLVPSLAEAGDRFDAISYGGATARARDYESMARLDERIAATRPVPRGATIGADA